MTIKQRRDDVKTMAGDTKRNLTFKSKKMVSDSWEKWKALTQEVAQRGSDLFKFSTEDEISAVKTDLQELAPSAKNTVSTLITNSKFQKGVSLPPQDNLCAKITKFSYMDPEKRPYQIEDYYLEPSYNSKFHCIYLNHQDKICIIGYRGTEVNEKKDLLSDAQIILWINAIDPRVTWSLKLFDEVRRSHPEYKKRVCWHSLGGTLCYIVSKHRKVDYCCTFNPWSAPNKIFILMLRDTLAKKERTQKIRTYKIIWDPISTFSYVGNTTSFFVWLKFNPIDYHRMSNFYLDDENVQNKQNEETVQSPQNVQNVQNIENRQSFQSFQNLQSFQDAQNEQSFQNVQNTQSFQNVQDTQNFQNVQNTQN